MSNFVLILVLTTLFTVLFENAFLPLPSYLEGKLTHGAL